MSFTPRLFLPWLSSSSKKVHLDEATTAYLTKILRFKPGDRVVGFDGQGGEYELILQSADSKQSGALVMGRKEVNQTSKPVLIALGQSLPKSSKSISS